MVLGRWVVSYEQGTSVNGHARRRPVQKQDAAGREPLSSEFQHTQIVSQHQIPDFDTLKVHVGEGVPFFSAADQMH